MLYTKDIKKKFYKQKKEYLFFYNYLTIIVYNFVTKLQPLLAPFLNFHF
ncbi:hypothetical protein SAMN05660909_02518 [Chitinophaga terrae (ex Kim and Jung 2007)]|uniref:Uncharacterized protein n=1 Tax=Chitinophaga terrae (ex Kim and Jung 2007) TaxID=408074 RepID=A0A1H4CB21_9BACT|nr:hypothetical protein [Chitinophaga terrae (ex Kim and Jung 2007)]SEA57635.1 hypothetical protein SAMN05660909_02518 [Chitinophaga terrae (ex Kim and Jung 2007)]